VRGSRADHPSTWSPPYSTRARLWLSGARSL